MPNTLVDGAPVWLPWCEAWLVGAAFWAAPADVLIASIDVQPEHFRDEALGTIWRAMLDVKSISVATVCALLYERKQLDEVGGEPRIAELFTAQQAMLMAGPASILAHAEIVRDWANRRAAMAAAQRQMALAYSGATTREKPVYERPEYAGVEV